MCKIRCFLHIAILKKYFTNLNWQEFWMKPISISHHTHWFLWFINNQNLMVKKITTVLLYLNLIQVDGESLFIIVSLLYFFSDLSIWVLQHFFLLGFSISLYCFCDRSDAHVQTSMLFQMYPMQLSHIILLLEIKISQRIYFQTRTLCNAQNTKHLPFSLSEKLLFFLSCNSF